MATTIERLIRQSHLFDDPTAYEAGVRDVVDALVASGVIEQDEASEVLEAARAA